MTNSADPDQLLLQKPTDLDLHCLLRQGMSCSAREGLKVKKCLGTCRFRSSCACAKYHLGLCSPVIHSVVSDDSVSVHQENIPI